MQEMKWKVFFCKKSVKLGGAFCKKVKNGFVVKSGKWGMFFVKKWTFPERRVHDVQGA